MLLVIIARLQLSGSLVFIFIFKRILGLYRVYVEVHLFLLLSVLKDYKRNRTYDWPHMRLRAAIVPVYNLEAIVLASVKFLFKFVYNCTKTFSRFC